MGAGRHLNGTDVAFIDGDNGNIYLSGTDITALNDSGNVRDSWRPSLFICDDLEGRN